jgi:hypothetical protein
MVKEPAENGAPASEPGKATAADMASQAVEIVIFVDPRTMLKTAPPPHWRGLAREASRRAQRD